MENVTDKKQFRSFGLTVGGIFALIGLWPAIFHAVIRPLKLAWRLAPIPALILALLRHAQFRKILMRAATAN